MKASKPWGWGSGDGEERKDSGEILKNIGSGNNNNNNNKHMSGIYYVLGCFKWFTLII